MFQNSFSGRLFFCNFFVHRLNQVVRGHFAQVSGAVFANRNRSILGFLASYNEHVRDFLDLGLPDFIPEFGVLIIYFGTKACNVEAVAYVLCILYKLV